MGRPEMGRPGMGWPETAARTSFGRKLVLRVRSAARKDPLMRLVLQTRDEENSL
jgi:hypothetical protein